MDLSANRSLVEVEGRCAVQADSKAMTYEVREKPEGVLLGSLGDQVEGAHLGGQVTTRRGACGSPVLWIYGADINEWGGVTNECLHCPMHT